MAMEALSSNELLLNFIIHDTINSSTPLYTCNEDSSFHAQEQQFFGAGSVINASSSMTPRTSSVGSEAKERQPNLAVQGRKKRRRRPKVCKNKEEAETQRMTHITVERNRRKQMNEHLAVLRSLMPESYVQRGDQASIVGGAIDFVKKLEHLLLSLEAQKFLQLQECGRGGSSINNESSTTTTTEDGTTTELIPNPFAQFFAYPRHSSSHMSNKFTCNKSNGAAADIEITLIETHANIRVLSRRRLHQLSRMVSGFQTICLNILHLNVTTLDPLVLYSISAKLEEGCLLNSADDIAGAVHFMLKISEEEAIPLPYEDHHQPQPSLASCP